MVEGLEIAPQRLTATKKLAGPFADLWAGQRVGAHFECESL